MDIKISRVGKVAVVEVTGRIDSGNTNKFGTLMDDAVNDEGYYLVLDLSGVEYLSSSSLREVVRVHNHCKHNDGDLRFTKPSDHAQEVIERAGLDTIFKISPTLVEAIGSFD